MNLQDRIEKYRERNFQQSDAEILILMEESAAAIFAAFPNHFILFGGAALVLFYGSPRVSRDLDLLPSPGPIPTAEEIQAIIRSRIQPIAEILGLGQLEFRREMAKSDFVKHWVLANQKTLFTIDLTRIRGNVLETQIVKKTIGGTSKATVLTPNRNYLLFQKSETFLSRRNPKARDAFDIHLLLSREAQLEKTLRAHLEDFILMNELDEEFIKARIGAVTPKLCTVELRPVLPPALFEQLEKEGFEPLRQSLRTLFSDWLVGGGR
jgi:Nucleotidyl transferase AbiEii toxin, Type IV TA system